jgi:hypothetical protein
MFNFFKKKQPIMPEFNRLKEYAHKDKYFYRTSPCQWLTKTQITIYDLNNPRLITLDDWPQQVYLDALSKITVAEYVIYMASLYKQDIPGELDEVIIYQLNQLSEDGLIAFSYTEITLDEKLANPMRLQKNSD